MKTEWRIFGLVAAFLFVACVVYAWWSWAYTNPHHVEWVGVVGLVLPALLCTMCGGYFWFVSRRIDLRPEDRAEAEIADGAGEVGFFSPGSYWPFGIALCAADRRHRHRVLDGLGDLVGMVFTVVGAPRSVRVLHRVRVAGHTDDQLASFGVAARDLGDIHVSATDLRWTTPRSSGRSRPELTAKMTLGMCTCQTLPIGALAQHHQP